MEIDSPFFCETDQVPVGVVQYRFYLCFVSYLRLSIFLDSSHLWHDLATSFQMHMMQWDLS